MANLMNSDRKKVAKPDMTPLVDLGFLLITFFMYSTTFTKPVNFSFVQPKKDGTSPVKESNTLTVLIGENDELLYHQTNETELETLEKVGDKPTDFRNLVWNTRSKSTDNKAFTVIIKPSDESTYNKFVDVLDEMIITKQERYAVVDVTKKEKKLLLKL